MNMNNMNNIVIEDSLIKDGKNHVIINKSGDYTLNLNHTNNNVVFDIKDNLSVNIIEINIQNVKTNITYNINNNSNVNINMFDDSNSIDRNITINLNGTDSLLNVNIGIISHNENNYKLNIFHNTNNTISNIRIHGITLDDGNIYILNNGYIPKGSYGSILKQDNKIIEMGNNISKIEPNLYIDEYDVEASHGAYIGKFDKDTIFYMNSRGLDDDSVYNLLIKGFLLEGFTINDNIKNDILKIISKYWR